MSKEAGRETAPPRTMGEEFANVDSSADSAKFVSYLDRVGDQVLDLKRRGYHLLDLKPGDAVLDVGCGPGIDVFGLEAVVGPSGRAVGADASMAMVEEARNRARAAGSRAEFHAGPAEALPFPDDTFDAVRTERVLMHVGDPERAVREMARVAKPGGRVFSIEPDHQMSAIDAADGALGDALFRKLHETMRSPRIGRRLRAAFLGAGLTQVELRVVPFISTSWSSFRTVTSFGDELDTLISLGVATEAQVRAFVSDLEKRDAEGIFFACLILMRCKGIKPEG